MPIYVTLAKYTPEALKNINDVADHTQQNTALIESKGGRLLSLYGLLGEWDFMAIMEFPDEKSAAGALLTAGKAGRFTTRTMQAIAAEDFVALTKDA